MRRPPRWFELLVRVTFPGGLLRDVHIRLLIVWTLPLVVLAGIGLGLAQRGGSEPAVVGGIVVLCGLGAFVVAYAWTLRFIVRTDRERPDGRHARR